MNKSKTFMQTTSALLLSAALFIPASSFADTQQPLDLNSADAKTLAKAVKGIGPKRAEAIVAYRDKHGAFKTLDDLVMVEGISADFLQKNRSELEKNIAVD